jgi:hypothetical protein
MDSFDHLKRLVDLSQVVKLRISFSDCDASIPRTQEILSNLFKETTHMRSLELSFEPGFVIDALLMDNICSLIPDHVKHLDIEGKTLTNIYLILDRLQHLSSITLRRLPLSFLPFITERYTQWRRDGTYRYHQETLHIWLDRSAMERDRTANSDELE